MREHLTLDLVEQVVMGGKPWKLSSEAIAAVERSYRFLEEFSRDKIIYGINTGFGPMAA